MISGRVCVCVHDGSPPKTSRLSSVAETKVVDVWSSIDESNEPFSVPPMSLQTHAFNSHRQAQLERVANEAAPERPSLSLCD